MIRRKIRSIGTVITLAVGGILLLPVASLVMHASVSLSLLIAVGAGVYVVLLAVIQLLLRRQVIDPLRRIMAYSAEVAEDNSEAELKGRFRFELEDLASYIVRMTRHLGGKLAFSEGVLNGVSLPYIVYDSDNRVVFINQNMMDGLALKGRREDYLGQTSGQVVFGDASRDRDTPVAKVLRDGKQVRNEVAFTTRGGVKKVYAITANPITDSGGKLLGVISLGFDLTEIKAQQHEIEAQRDRIAEAAKAADAISGRLSTAAEELSAQIEESSRGTEVQRERLGETSSAVGQMNASVMDVARNSSDAASSAAQAREKAQAGEQVVEKVIDAFKKVEDSTLAMKGHVEDLSRKASSIGQVVQIIEDIADQTNLLALNAAIEAARAGDAGRGFAVVADEVRKLAEKTMGATKDVGTSVREIQGAIGTALALMDTAGGLVVEARGLSAESGVALREIVRLSGQSAGQVQSIATAAEEQSAASEQITRGAAEVSTIASETADSMTQSAHAVSELARMAGELKELIGRMRA